MHSIRPHPTVLIVSLVVLTCSLSFWLSWTALCVVLAAGLTLLLFGSYQRLWIRGLWRMKWFWLSITLVFGWWTPGDAVIAAWGDWSPTWQGLLLGLQRMLLLMTLMLMTYVLCKSVSRQELVSGIVGCFARVRSWQALRDKLALRFALTLELVTNILDAPQLNETKNAAAASETRGRLQRFADTALGLFLKTLDRSAATSPTTVAIPAHSPVPTWQWLLPCFVFALILILFYSIPGTGIPAAAMPEVSV